MTTNEPRGWERDGACGIPRTGHTTLGLLLAVLLMVAAVVAGR